MSTGPYLFPLNPEDFPKLLEIGASTYHVIFFRRLKDDDCGGCDDDAKVISISLNQSPEEMNATFWHEVLHAIETEYKMELGHPKIRKLEWAIFEVFSQLLKRKVKSDYKP